MTGRSWMLVVTIAVVASALIGIAGQIDVVSNTFHRAFPRHTDRVECQDSPSCRDFVKQLVADTLRDLRGGGAQSPRPGNQLPGASRPPHQRNRFLAVDMEADRISRIIPDQARILAVVVGHRGGHRVVEETVAAAGEAVALRSCIYRRSA